MVEHTDELGNLRTVGQRRAGRVRVGRPVKAAPGSVPFSSIPTKYETVTQPHMSESRAFGSQVPRFGEKLHELPGPGSYFKPGSLIKESDSISKKGYGTLTSGDKRWRHSRRQWTGPGPGEYQHRSGAADRAATSFNKARTTANFHRTAHPAHGDRAHDADTAQPGPGSYEHMRAHYNGTRVKWVDTPHTGQASAFKAVSRHMELAGSRDAPGAGQYHLAKDWSQPETHFSQFKNHSTREPPAKGGDGLPAVIFNEQRPPQKGGPGPGTYNMQEVQSIHRKILSHPGRITAAFALGLTDRFGRPVKPRSVAYDGPGPGTYAPPTGAFSEREGMASSFVSTASKSALLGEKQFRDLPPGPAYYNPVKHGTKASHHLNARRRFLSAV